MQTRHGARPEADPAAATVAAAQQEVMLVPRMVYMPFVAQTPQTAMRFTVSQQASAQMVQTQQNFVQPGALVNTATATQSGVNLNATLLEAANNGTLDPRVAAAIREALARPNANVAAPSSTNAEKEAADRIRAATKEIESLNQKLNLLEKALQGLQPNPAPAPTPPGPMSPTAMPMPLPTSSLPPQLGPTLSPGVTLVSPTPIPTRLPNAN